jgi:predicted phage-related endonuclease
MLKFDEDISFTKTTSDEAGIFLERKSILHYKDDDVTSKLCNSLENKLKKYYEDRKDIEIEFDPYRSNSTFDIIININFKQKDSYYHLTKDFKENFETIYNKFKEQK